MCPTVFSMIKGKNTFNLFHIVYPPFNQVCTTSQAKCRTLGLKLLSVNLQVHLTGQYGQHVSKHGPPGGGREGGDAIQAGLPPGE